LVNAQSSLFLCEDAVLKFCICVIRHWQSRQH